MEINLIKSTYKRSLKRLHFFIFRTNIRVKKYNDGRREGLNYGR
nr:MAG TPA: hypothetical protein [Caudoviricetes sp.]